MKAKELIVAVEAIEDLFKRTSPVRTMIRRFRRLNEYVEHNDEELIDIRALLDGKDLDEIP